MAQLPLSTIVHQVPPDQVSMDRFLRALDPTAKSFLFVIIKEHNSPKVLRAPATEQLFTSLSNANINQYNVYVTINETTNGVGITRTREEVTRFTAVFADDDGKTVAKPYPLEPSAVVETSPGKKQVYWFLASQPAHVDEWDGVQQTIVNEYGGDAQSRDASRILRVPGFYNAKPDYNPPPPVRIVSLSDKRYTWEQILRAFPPSQITMASGGDRGAALDYATVLEQAATGTNYHEANLRLAGWLANMDPSNRDQLITLLQAQISVLGNPADPRFIHRRDKDIPLSVDWVLKKRAQEQDPEPLQFTEHKADKYTRLPTPGGGLHRVMKWVLTTMRYPNESIAIIVAEHLVSVFGGGHYHIMNNTTTRKRIALAPLGSGKNTVTRCMGLVIRGLGSLNNDSIPHVLEAEKFVGSDSFSFSVQHTQLQEHRVRSFVVNEAGEAGKSSAGDIGNLRAYQLQALSTKADELFIPKKFSEQGKGAEAKQLKTVYNGVWVYFHESTVKSYAELLRDSSAFVNGDLSRSDMFFINPIIGVINKNTAGMAPDILEYFANMANDFRKLPGAQGSTDHTVWEEVDYSEITPQLHVLEQATVKQRNVAYTRENEIKIALLGRRFERILTSILICAIADAGGITKPVARKHHFDYAVQRADAIDQSLTYHAHSGGVLGDDTFGSVKDYFIEAYRSVMKRSTPEKLAKKYVHVVNTAKGARYRINKSSLNRVLMKTTVMKPWVEIYHDDRPKAELALMKALEDIGVAVRVKEKDSEGRSVPVAPPKWDLCPNLFPMPL